MNQKYSSYFFFWSVLAISFVVVLSASDASADNFPFEAAGLRWSETLTPPADGRAAPGFTNGCVRLNEQRQAILDSDNFAFTDYSRCTSTSDRKVVVADSEAATACEKIGGRLPTKTEFETLIRSYEYIGKNGWPHLPTTKEALSRDFGEDIFQPFWSSSPVSGYPDYAFYFNGYDVSVSFTRRDGTALFAVRCVRDR